MADIYPFPLPRQQLPQPTDRLSDGFLRALPAPVGLWMPSKLAQAAADFTPLPQKHFGSLNGGITTTASGFGVLENSWKFSSGAWNLGTSASLQITGPISVVAVVSSTDTSAGTKLILGNWTSVSKNNFGLFWNTATDVTSGGVAHPGNICWLAGNIFAGSQIASISNGSFADGKPHLIVGTADPSGGSFKSILYVDNQSSTAGAAANNPASNASASWYFGGAPPSSWFFSGNGLLACVVPFVLNASQVSSLYQSLRTGEPFPLFQPQTAAMMFGSAAAPAGGGGGFLIGGGIGNFLCAA